MPTSVTAINDTAANEPPSEAGAPTLANDDDRDLRPPSAGHTDNFHHDTRTNRQAADLSEESLSQHRETTNGVSGSDNAKLSPRLTSVLPNSPVPQVESESIRGDIDSTGGAHQTEPQANSSSPNAAESSRPADKRKRGKQTIVKSSSGEALSEGDVERGRVLEFGLNTQETLRRVVFGSRAANNSMLRTPSTNWSFTKMFGDGDFIAAGQVCIHPNCEKPLKNVTDNTYIFFVIEGVIEARIHKNSYTIASGGTFMVPRGNNYALKNISSHDARIFFCQARKLPMSENEEHARASLLPIRHDDPPTSKASMLGMWLLQRLVAHIWRLHDRILAWYKKNLAKYERFATARRLYLLFFVLGLMVRRLPFIGSPPLINIQFVRVV